MSVRLRPRAGISLLTVLVGLFVIGFLAVVAIPGYFNRHDVTLENACRLVSRDLRTLQNRAALDKLTVRMVFDSDGWRALDTNDKPVAGIGESHPVVRRFEGEGVFAGVVIERIDLGGDNELAIDRRGLVDKHGELDISFRGETRRVKIHRGSGDIGVAPLAR
jgi:type II secretory pathway pseudopilin PulG